MTTTIGDGRENVMMQVVDYEENFNRSLEMYLKRNNLSNRGFDYHVAAIMGPQSSGKSTLLNILFGTEFRTMDADSGRYQVTQGVWLGRDVDADIVVMDLEGTDSRERGEDAATFERKSSLFALALAEVLIVNIWTQDVGRFNAANLSLLKTVLEQDLQLFSGGATDQKASGAGRPRTHKTRLLFVLRDYYAVSVGGTSLERLEAVLRTDVNNIWNSISKPESAVGTDVTDFFDLDFFALPHKVLMPEPFMNAGLELKRRFHSNELFLKEYNRGVAADGFAAYAESVWDTIRANKELDIPSQKEMLAHVRCEQIAREVVDEVDEALVPVRQSLLPPGNGAPVAVDNLYNTLLNIVNSALNKYQEAAGRYSSAVAEKKAIDLHTKLGSTCKSLYDSQTIVVTDRAISDFRETIAEISRSSEPWVEFGSKSQRACSDAISSFDIRCETGTLPASCLPPVVNPHPLSFAQSSYVANRKRLQSALSQELDRVTSSLHLKTKERCHKTFSESFKPPLSTVLDNAKDDAWERSTEVANKAWEKTASLALKIYGPHGLALGEAEVESVVEDELKPDCYEMALKLVKELIGSSSTFLLRVTKAFDDAFRFDDRGVPRVFGPDEDIEALFVLAREEGEKVIERLSVIKLGGELPRLRESAREINKEDVNAVAFETHDQTDLREKLRRQAGAVFMEAKRAQEAAKVRTKVPIWLFALLVILGWNEIMMVLRNPWLLLLTMLVVPALYVGYFLDGANMLVPAVRTAAAPYIRQAMNIIDQYVPEDGPKDDGTPSASSASVPASGISPVAHSDGPEPALSCSTSGSYN